MIGGSIYSGVGPLLCSALGSNAFDEFVETTKTRPFILSFYDNSLTMALVVMGSSSRMGSTPNVNTMDNATCVELLRGPLAEAGGKGVGKKPQGMLGVMGKAANDLRHGKITGEGTSLNDELVREMRKSFGPRTSFISNPMAGLRDTSSPFTSLSSKSADIIH